MSNKLKMQATLVLGLVALMAGCVAVEKNASENQTAQRAVIASATAPQRLFLQQVGSHSAIVKWRGPAAEACYKPVSASWSGAVCETAVSTEANHREVLLSNLQAYSEYHYSVGGFHQQGMQFHTAPATGSLPADGTIRLWVVGDSGTASKPVREGEVKPDGAVKVMQGFRQFAEQDASEKTDLMLMLGDNAYQDGTDTQWQVAVFDVFAPMLEKMPLWSTIGNHEMGAAIIDSALLGPEYAKKLAPNGGDIVLGGVSTSADPNSFVTAANRTPRRMPYLDILSLPADAELGGVPSGTEQYYSFDYGTVHIVSLDSQLSMRDPLQRRAMRQWLEADLAANTLDWTVVIFHHPVYTKGSHDSDHAAASRFSIDQPILDLRTEFTPVFEQYGVDLTFSGHSHAYERSWYLHGHRGDADTFDAVQHAELNAAGQPAQGSGDERYYKSSKSSQRDDKVVYTVAGSSGHVSLGHGKLNHPANAIQHNDAQQRHGLAELGSVVVDASATSLTARFINDQGKVLDTVVIEK